MADGDEVDELVVLFKAGHWQQLTEPTTEAFLLTGLLARPGAWATLVQECSLAILTKAIA